MFDSAYVGDPSNLFSPHNPYAAGDASFFDTAEPRKAFHCQKLGMYLVSDLFASSFMGTSRFVKNRRLVSLARGKTLSFTGESFDQWDLDVLLHCAMRTALSPNGSGEIQVNPGEMLRDMGFRNYDDNRDRVYSSLFRLHTGTLLIEGQGYRYMTGLIDRVLLDQSKKGCLVEVNGDIVNSLQQERNISLLVESRLGFKRCGLAKWLHGATTVFKGGFKADVSSLHQLCGASNRSRYIFPRMLGKALDMMSDDGIIDSWEFDGRRLMVLPASGQQLNAACGFIPPRTA